ncbi:Heterogeneous nuclear ribonucleoprotein 1 [Ananas comosus]|uniref:Heterogeneous nuclear ribonucleoprotein 1 n=1 Tax=Ananas comosus TaxID=4615 RepID=A0A199WB55_ANACO|nr:Heterogeneous nuclear ribonucleoprotein 1 [Ananas comosus]
MQIAVRGVPLSASEEDLKNHFGRYGQVLAVVEDAHGEPQDSDDKQAFIFFADSASAMRASASREKNNHIILGKLVEVSRFSIWLQQRRIEAYNLPPGTTSSQFRAYFEEFGTVTEAAVGPDGSGYVVFKWDESLRKVLRKKLHLFYTTEEAFLVANAAQHESAGATGSAAPYACGVAYIPTRPLYTDSTPIATTPEAHSKTPQIEDTAVAHRALNLDEKDNNNIDGHKVDVKQAELKENANVSNDKKIFVGGLPKDITDDEFRAYFEKFGPITNALIRTDKNNSRPRGFGFVTFETEESADEVLKNQQKQKQQQKQKEQIKLVATMKSAQRLDS